MRATSGIVDPRISLCETGLSLGAETRLARFAGATSRLAVDETRLEALFAVAFQRAPSSRDLSAIDAAATHWQRGDKALANLRLVFADLPRLHQAEDAVRLKAAELMFDAGLRADDLAKFFDADAPAGDLGKYDPNQPRVPAGSGKTSGRWTALWSRFGAWLDEEVPEYDQDTGDEVGTRSRARAILTNPLTILGAGAAVLLGGEVALPAIASVATAAPEATAVVAAPEVAATALAPVAEEAEVLSPVAQRYLNMTGGRLGGAATRQQLYDIAQDFATSGNYKEYRGDGMAPEEYIRGPGPGTRGSTYVDFTATAMDGTKVRIQTVDTLSDGLTPTGKEAAAAMRIRAARPTEKLILIPKVKP